MRRGRGTVYVDPGGDFYTRLNPDKAKNRALDQLHKMGYAVTLNPLGATGEDLRLASAVAQFAVP